MRRPLRLIYCASACRRDWKRRAKRIPASERVRLGQRYAEEIRPGVWMCLCCKQRV